MAKSNFQLSLNEAFADALTKQSGFARRKNTIAAVAAGVLQVVNFAGVFLADAPAWVTVLVAAIIALAEAVFHATTKASLAPSQKDDLLAAAPDDTPNNPTPAPAPVVDGGALPILPTYPGPTTAEG